MTLLQPLDLGPLRVANRVMFGPIVTNLGNDNREFTERHTAFYARRARGGCALIVTEGASVHPSDWPLERMPLAERCAAGWRSIVDACAPFGAAVVASLDHAGGQGSSAFSQAPLLAPSRVPEVNSREVPKWMEEHDIRAVIDGFGAAAALAVGSGCAGVEVNAGQHSLVRQFLSGLTNHRGDEWGADRLRFAREVITTVRSAIGAGSVLGLRLCCDELAPWAGITPEMAPGIAAELCAAGVDYLVVVRGSIFSAEKTRPDFHEPTGFNIDTCRAVRAAVGVPVYLQGSVIDAGQAEWAVSDGVCDGVEMTRAQLADPDLLSKLGSGARDRIRPCTRCNQTCQVRDARNPIITCVGEPTTGRETEDPDWTTRSARPRSVLVAGGGPAGLEAARIAALRGHRVRLVERSAHLGGNARTAGPAGALVDWLVAECAHAGVTIETNTEWDPGAGGAGARGNDGHARPDAVIQCTGSIAGERPFALVGAPVILDVAAVRSGAAHLPAEGPVVLYDPIGGPIAVALAEELGERAVLVTQDNIAANELARTGDLAPANVRLQQRGVHIERRSLLREAHTDHVVLEDRFGAGLRRVDCVAVVDCGFRLPAPPLAAGMLRAGDCVAPRTVHEAILEARRVAHSL